MRNLFLWYLPQAALFAFGVWVSATMQPPATGAAMVAVGLMLAGSYTAAVMVIRDAPANWRGLTRNWRLSVIGMGFGLVALTAFLCYRLGLPLSAILPLSPFIALLWLLMLGLTNSLVARRLGRHRSKPRADGEGLATGGRLTGQSPQERERVRIGQNPR